MKFSIFGLGDTSYELYQEMLKYFEKAFIDLGATKIYKSGEGNAETFSTEDDFDEWKNDLWSEIFKVYSEQETPEQAAISLKKSASTVKARSGDKSKLPLKVKIIKDDSDEYTKPEKVQYEMAIRQYIGGKDVTLKGMQQLR
mmetsp:Transcript_13133/g.9192  ORF Transcript_13133/g.9192 Transcript_13133/m.9192 type:complete len:142 (+) Transcript_13133:514-939(+)